MELPHKFLFKHGAAVLLELRLVLAVQVVVEVEGITIVGCL
jgi:hypothetical protein